MRPAGRRRPATAATTSTTPTSGTTQAVAADVEVGDEVALARRQPEQAEWAVEAGGERFRPGGVDAPAGSR